MKNNNNRNCGYGCDGGDKYHNNHQQLLLLLLTPTPPPQRVSLSNPGQNYFLSNGDDFLNEVLANGSILTEIIFLHSNCIYYS